MPRRIWLLLALLTACATHDVHYYNADYWGLVRTPCWGEVRVYGHVVNGIFVILLPGRHDLFGSVTPDGAVIAKGSWNDEQRTVQSNFTGQISSKMFGSTLTGQLQDGRCNPNITLYPRKSAS